MNLFSFFSKLFGIKAKRGPLSFPVSPQAVIFGLGNPGPNYSNTRHNVGYRAADAICSQLREVEKGEWADSEYESGLLGGIQVAVVKPRTFMNRSGHSVGQWVREFGIPLQKTAVIVDDFNLPLGSLRLRQGGSAGGHNGLKSIIEKIGPDFPRLRIGIGPLPPGADIIKFVLSDFNSFEEQAVESAVQRAVDAIILFLQKGVETAMSKFNK